MSIVISDGKVGRVLSIVEIRDEDSLKPKISDNAVQTALLILTMELERANTPMGFHNTPDLARAIESLCDVWRVQKGHARAKPEDLGVENDGSLDDFLPIPRYE